MRVELPDQELVDRLIPPLDEEEIATLQAAGVRFPTGEALPPFQPVKPRPRWLAFVLRMIGRA